MKNKILQILNEIEPECDFENSVDFFEDELIDSFGIITMITMIEEWLNISINPDDIIAVNFMNLENIEKLLKEYV